jgi:predicted RNA-binding protein with EMAP domain
MACFITIFSLVLFLIALVHYNTKIDKIRFEIIIEEKIYAEIPPEILSNIQKQQLITKLSPIKEELLPSHDYYTKYIDFLHESYTTKFLFNLNFF